MPSSIQGFYAGTLLGYQQSLGTMPILVLTALLAVYIVLGILYENLVHPITIISTLPSAGVGAMLALTIGEQRSECDLDYRHRTADRNRKKERDHDDRFRPASGAPGRERYRGRDF